MPLNSRTNREWFGRAQGTDVAISHSILINAKQGPSYLCVRADCLGLRSLARVSGWLAARRECVVALGVLSEFSWPRKVLQERLLRGTSPCMVAMQVQAVHLTAEPFSVENGLLTPSFKLKRPQAKEAFAGDIEAMYRRLDARG